MNPFTFDKFIAPRVLEVLHALFQFIVLIYGISMIMISPNTGHWAGSWIIVLIALPIIMFLIRIVFEIIAVQFKTHELLIKK